MLLGIDTSSNNPSLALWHDNDFFDMMCIDEAEDLPLGLSCLITKRNVQVHNIDSVIACITHDSITAKQCCLAFIQGLLVGCDFNFYSITLEMFLWSALKRYDHIGTSFVYYVYKSRNCITILRAFNNDGCKMHTIRCDDWNEGYIIDLEANSTVVCNSLEIMRSAVFIRKDIRVRFLNIDAWHLIRAYKENAYTLQAADPMEVL